MSSLKLYDLDPFALVPVLEMLLKVESSERDVRSIKYQMKVTKFPIYRDLPGFDFN